MKEERIAHGTVEDAINTYLDEFKKVVDADGFMAAIWVIVDGRLQLVCCTTHNFPLEDRPIAEQQLREVNKNEAVAAMTPEPLPLADHLRPMSFPVPGNNNRQDVAAKGNVFDTNLKDDESEIVSEEGMNPKGEDDDALSD